MERQRIVVKIGSSSLTHPDGALSHDKIRHWAQAIARLRQSGHSVILISSGAVAAGFRGLGYPNWPEMIPAKQASAAVGQSLLMQAWADQFDQHQITTAQLLLTREDFSDRTRYQNAHATLTELLGRGALPIINENDSVSIAELTFGDNDMLSALVSGLMHADMLMIMTDINGLYDADPRENPNAYRYPYLPRLPDRLIEKATSSGSRVGTGGMRSKVEAAQTALSLGVRVFIGTGQENDALIAILTGRGDGTYIGSKLNTVKARKQWIGLHSKSAGHLVIDPGAEHALLKGGKSLLPVGVLAAHGTFQSGDVVEVLNTAGQRIGKGIVGFSAFQLNQIKGRSTADIRLPNMPDHEEVIHRDDWVALEKEMMS